MEQRLVMVLEREGESSQSLMPAAARSGSFEVKPLELKAVMPVYIYPGE